MTGAADEGTNPLTEAEKKKLRNKKKKAALKKKQEEEKKKKKNEPNAKADDLDADKLINEAQDNPLQKAKEWVRWLEELR